MTLDVDNADAYLLRHGLVHMAAIVGGDLRVTSVPGRNRNLRIERRRGPGYFLKQPDPMEQGAELTLATEIGFHQFCREEPSAAAVGEYLPRLVHHDCPGPRLVFELLTAARSLSQVLESHRADRVPPDPWRAVGQALGILHRTFRGTRLARHPFVFGLSQAPPWTQDIRRPVSELVGLIGPGHRRAVRILQTEEELGAKLEALPPFRVETLVHGDVKSENIMISTEREDGRASVCLIDWEMVQRGDSAWDVAGMLQDVLVQWIHHMPHAAELATKERQRRARYPLATLQPLIRAFWHGYGRTAELEPAATAELLGRAIPFSALRLVQSAYEHASDSERLPSASVLMLQVASNILAHPARAALHLYGLSTVLPRNHHD